MKRNCLIFLFSLTLIVSIIIIASCAVSKTVAEKSGSQLWGENCIRCHNAPSSAEYGPAQWETIDIHMKLRANLTDDETNKILVYLKSAN
jgi:hypothetical protein